MSYNNQGRPSASYPHNLAMGQPQLQPQLRSQYHQPYQQQSQPSFQSESAPPYPTQPYPGFVSYHAVNFSTDSISRRIRNRDETSLNGTPTGPASNGMNSNRAGNMAQAQLYERGMKSSNSLISASSDGSAEYQNTRPSPAHQRMNISTTYSTPKNQEYQLQGGIAPIDESNSLHSTGRLQGNPSQSIYPNQSCQSSRNVTPLGYQNQVPSQSKPHVQESRVVGLEREASIGQLSKSMESLKTDEELDSISRFNAMRQRALSPNNISNGPIQVEWTTILLAAASDKGFVSKYTLNSEPMKSDASPSEIKKNEHSFIKAAIKTLKRTCSDLKDSEAQFILGSLYSNSPTIKVPKPDLLERNYEKAFDYYAKAGSQGHALALYRLGVSFELGIGVSMNEQRALDAFARSAQAGSVPSMFKLGLIYSRGVLGARRSAAKSMEWLIKASHNADLENPHALFELSKIMERDLPFIASPSPSDMEYLRELDRLGYTKDEDAGLNYCKEAAKLGYSPAQCKLGWCYEYGKLGCVIDAKKSIGWYSRAAKQGNPQAEMALSGWYLTGAKNILEPNDREAFLWALKSTEGGFVKAEYALGYYYEVGLGCERDLEMAKRFYRRAATQGHEKAIEKLRAMRPRRM